MNKLSFLILTFLFISIHLFSQTILFSEDFESGELPYEWSQSYVTGAVNWRYENGGYTTQPSIPNSRRPPAAHGGSYNALFQLQSINNEATKLITKKISSLEFAIKPELHFWHAQYEWKHGTEFYNDELKVYYKNSAEGDWILLKEYIYETTDWVERIIPLPDSTLSGDYYIAFEGKTNWGWGTCIDDIEIIETGIRNKVLSNMIVTQASDLPISSGSKNNPILRFNFKVFGNSSTCYFDSLVVTSLNTNDADISENGVKLFFTEETEFNSSTPVGTPQNFVGGKATFNNIGFDLPIGYSYLWVTYDVDSLAEHNDIADIKILPGNILINDTLYPVNEISPAGNRIIYQTIYFDDFEGPLNWDLSGEFEHGEPQGLGGTQGNPDPTGTLSGVKIIGTDLTGLNSIHGDYETNVSDREYKAVSPVRNFKYYNDLLIRYQRWLNVGINDYVRIEISDDNGATWETAWQNASLIIDEKWTLHEVDISDLAGRKENVRIRFSLGPTNEYWQFSGWNIDDFSITGNYITKDVGVTGILKPVDGCYHSSADSITVIVKNFSAEPSPGIIPIRYVLSGGGKTQVVNDTIHESLIIEGSTVFTFAIKADISVPDIYNLTVTTLLPGDEDNTNNQASINLFAQPTLSLPHFEDFEVSKGLWINYGKNYDGWEWGTPNYGIIPPSGSQLWKTKISQYYLNSDSSFVESGCYDFNNENRYMVELKYWLKTEADEDGASVQYSLNNGLNWNNIEENELGWDWGWYTQLVNASNLKGWSGDSSKWITTHQLLPSSIPSDSKIKFRVIFASDLSENDVGFAFDDFNIYPAPPDVGVSKIVLPNSACLFENPDHISVYIKNYGLNDIKTNDTIPVGYKINEDPAVYNNCVLTSDIEPGDSILYTFNEDLELNTPGTYQIYAFSLLEDDPWFYFGNNDTAHREFDILPLPFTGLPDTIQSREPDTVILRAHIDPNYSYNWESGLSLADTFKVPRKGTYHVLVTDIGGNGCSILDSVYVELLFYDPGLSEYISPVSACELTNNEKFTIQLYNFGTDSIEAGRDITLSYQINGGVPVNEVMEFEQTLHAYHSINYTFNTGADISAEDVYDLKFYCFFGSDTVKTNDTITTSIEVYGYPTVNIGENLTVKALNYTLDAGAGFKSYLWENGDTLQTHLIDTTGDYSVTVTDENNCPAYDEVHIRLKIRDVMPIALTNPVSTCEMTEPSTVQIRVLNNGNDTLFAGEQITVQYDINGGTTKSGTIVLNSSMLPGTEWLYTFTATEDLTQPDDYIFAITTSTAGDLRSGNDAFSDTISIYPKPVVDFGYNYVSTAIYVEESQVVLDAGEGAYYDYLWQDNSKNSTFTATQSYQTYKVTVTDTRTGCYDRDSVRFILQQYDIGVTSVDLPASVCSGPQNNVKIQIKNHLASLPAGTNIHIVNTVNGVITGQETKTLTSSVAFGTSINHTLVSPIIIPGAESAVVNVYTDIDNDIDVTNDAYTVNISSIKPSPIVNFGDDNGVLLTTFPHVLDAGADQPSYLWENGLTTQTRTISNEGTYSVTVTGTNGCQTYKSVTVSGPSGFEEVAENKLKVSVYPNPASDYFNLDIDATEYDDIVIEVYSNNGVLMHQTKSEGRTIITEKFDIENYPDGLYYIKLYNKNINYIYKIIIY